MGTKIRLSKLRATLSKHQHDDRRTDVVIIATIMDEIVGAVPDEASDAIGRAQHKRTGYTFPASKEPYELLSSG